jgi:hypothetical protein
MHEEKRGMRTHRAVLAAIVLALALPGVAQGATFAVNSTQDFARCDIGAFEFAPAPPPAQPAQPTPPAPTGQVKGETARRCVSRRAFVIRLRVPRGMQVRRATVWVNGKKVAVRRGQRLTATVNLRNFRAGRFTVRIVITLRGGGVIKGERRYHTCRKAIAPKQVPKV